MCGIAGFAAAPDPKTLRRMVATLTHRGPDDDGYFEAPEVSLGMRRLSIIDVETGKQPVFNETGSVAVVYNGEIYNYIELRAELARRGHRFSTDHSDTETIVHLYEDHGLDFPHKLNGMFAIALWDAERRRLVLVRDRAGVKPLYFAMVPGGIAFGSEPKALLAHPAVSREPDFAALHHFLSFKNVPAPLSAFAAIRQLGPGEMLVWENGRCQQRRWWQVRFQEDQNLAEDEAAHRIRAILEDAVRLRMRSDVAFGAYLSGGLDSSSVVALMSRFSTKPLETFTLVYEDAFAQKDSDRAFARAVAEQCGTQHREHLVRFADVPQYADEIVTAFDEPYSGVISTFFITQMISRHVKVALSGDGADELFGSYRPHRLAEPLAAWRRLRGSGSNLGPDEIATLGDYATATDELERIVSRGDEAAARMQQLLLTDAEKYKLYTPRMRELVGLASSEMLVREAYRRAGTDDPLNRALFVDFETLLPDQVLAFVDRLSMAHSVEVRPPFLDYRLIEFAATIPGRMKIRGGRVKHILKQAVGDLLPAGLADRPKEGFLMPINDWLVARLKPYLKSVLDPARIRRHGLIAPDAVAALIAEHEQGKRRNGDRLWNLMMFQLWWEAYQERPH
jgi:asparagine synthase (glutamine-hydrolysing)